MALLVSWCTWQKLFLTQFHFPQKVFWRPLSRRTSFASFHPKPGLVSRWRYAPLLLRVRQAETYIKNKKSFDVFLHERILWIALTCKHCFELAASLINMKMSKTILNVFLNCFWSIHVTSQIVISPVMQIWSKCGSFICQKQERPCLGCCRQEPASVATFTFLMRSTVYDRKGRSPTHLLVFWQSK